MLSLLIMIGNFYCTINKFPNLNSRNIKKGAIVTEVIFIAIFDLKNERGVD